MRGSGNLTEFLCAVTVLLQFSRTKSSCERLRSLLDENFQFVLFFKLALKSLSWLVSVFLPFMVFFKLKWFCQGRSLVRVESSKMKPQNVELVSKELNHLAAILHVYAGAQRWDLAVFCPLFCISTYKQMMPIFRSF